MPKQNYYEFFGLKDFEDDQIVIKRAYRSMALKWHPDRHQEDKENAEHMMKQVNEVYRVLSTCKKSYDRHIGRKYAGNNEKPFKGFFYEEAEEVNEKMWDEIFKKAQGHSKWSYAFYGKTYKSREEAAEAKRQQAREQKEREKPKGSRKIYSLPLEEQQEIKNIILAWTLEEFTAAKRYIKSRRELGI